MEEEPHVYVLKPVEPTSALAAEEPAVRLVWFPTQGNAHHCKKGLQQYGDKSRSSIMTELLQLVDKKTWRL